MKALSLVVLDKVFLLQVTVTNQTYLDMVTWRQCLLTK